MTKETFFKNPACPVGCDYCMVTKINQRSSRWVKQHRYGLNKTLTFINKFPFEKELIEWNSDFLRNEYIGFEGISDPFWKPFRQDLFNLLGASKISKKVILVTKFILSEDLVKKLSIYPQLVIVNSLTGLDKYDIEQTKTKDRIKNIELCMKYDIPTLAFIHPYIHTLTDLSMLKDLASLGIKEVSFKGFRFNKENMPKVYKALKDKNLYNTEEEVLLGKEYINEELSKNNLKNIEFREWVHFRNTEYANTKGFKDKKEAEEVVNQLFKNITISSSEKAIDTIKDIAIKRRMQGFENGEG